MSESRIDQLLEAVDRFDVDGVIADLRVYGAHERPLTDHRTGEEGCGS